MKFFSSDTKSITVVTVTVRWDSAEERNAFHKTYPSMFNSEVECQDWPELNSYTSMYHNPPEAYWYMLVQFSEIMEQK